MNALTFTITLLMLLAAVTYARLQQGTDTALGAYSMKLRLEARRNVESQYQDAIYVVKNLTRWKSGYTGPTEEKKPSDGASRPTEEQNKEKKKEKKRELPNYPALLNLAPILSQKTDPLMHTLERLLQINYEEQEFFPPGTEKTLLEALSYGIDKFQGTLACADQLGCIDLGDPALQKLWITILKGREGHYPSLLDQISFDPKRSAGINILWAPEALLLAALQEPALVEHLLIKRAELIEYYATIEKASDANKFLEDLPNQLEQLIINFPTTPPEIRPYLSYDVTDLPSSLVLRSTASPYALKERRPLVIINNRR